MPSIRCLLCGLLLAGGLASQTEPVTSEALEALETLIADLASEQIATRTKAVRAILAHPPSPELDRLLVDLLQDVERNPPVPPPSQWRTAPGGGRFRSGADDEAVLREPTWLLPYWTPPFLVERAIVDTLDLEFPWPVRALAAFVLGRRKRPDSAVDASLWRAFSEDEDDLVASLSAYAVEERARRDPDFAATVLDACEQRTTAKNKWLLARNPDWVTERLPAWLRSKRWHRLRLGLSVLRVTGLANQQIADAAEDLLGGPYARSRLAVPVLADLGPAAIPMLGRALDHRRNSTRQIALGTLALMESGAAWPESIVARLVDFAGEDHPLRAHWAMRALAKAKLAPDQLDRVRRIALRLTQSNSSLSQLIGCEHLAAFPFTDSETLDALYRCSDEPLEPLRLAAVIGLSRRHNLPDYESILPLLTWANKGHNSDRSRVRARAALTAVLARNEALLEVFVAGVDPESPQKGLLETLRDVACEAAKHGKHLGFLERRMDDASWSAGALRAALAIGEPSDRVRTVFAQRWANHPEERASLIRHASRLGSGFDTEAHARELLESEESWAVRSAWAALLERELPPDLVPRFRAHVLKTQSEWLLDALPRERLARYVPTLRKLLGRAKTPRRFQNIADVLRKAVKVEKL